MIALCLILVAVGFAIALPATLGARALGHRLNALDGPGVAGQVKMRARKVPNTGGVAIFLGVVLPLIGILILVTTGAGAAVAELVPALSRHLPGIREQTGPALALVGGLIILHVMGLIDDRRPLGPWLKLAVMLAVATAVVAITRTRLLTLLDPHVGGPWLSFLVTVLWLAAVTNAINFMDNMDGLAAGVGAIASAFFMAAALVNSPPQWFVAGTLGLLLGSLLAFLVFNFPRPGGASIFMGDSGSLVVGFLLGFLTARTTYYSPELGGGWYAVFMPLVVLAVPLYDFTTVTAIRLSQGKSPFVGDLQHLSHRLVRRGLSRRGAVIVIYAFTAVTAVGGISLGSLSGWQAVLVGVQTALVLVVLAIEEWASVRGARNARAQRREIPGRGRPR